MSLYEVKNANLASATYTAESCINAIDNSVLLVYPPCPSKGRLTIRKEHVKCLEEKWFLNDVIIEFYLTYIYIEVLTSFDRQRTYFFNTFFYSNLASNTSGNFLMRHNKVKRWTKNVNIFDKDFIIVPVNKNSHWFVIIVCFRSLSGAGGVPIKKRKLLHAESSAMIEQNSSQVEENNEKIDTGNKTAYIIVLDSIQGMSCQNDVDVLVRYLECEYQAKVGRACSGQSLKYHSIWPTVPQQTNGTDCGIYVLQYVESFFLNPIPDFRYIASLKHWFPEEKILQKRKEIYSLIVKKANKNVN